MASLKIILKNRAKSDQGTLYLQIILSRRDKTEISLGKKIDTKDWDKVKEKVKRSNPNATSLNVYLKNEKSAYEDIINYKLARQEEFTVKDVVTQKKGVTKGANDKSSFINFFQNYVNENPENLRFNTMQSYKTCLNKVLEYSPNLSFKDFNLKWVQKFEKHLKNQGNAINTVADKMKVLNKLAKLCLKNKTIKTNPFEGYKHKTEPGKREFLIQEELLLLKKLKVEQPSYIVVRDVFLFCCYTGLRFSDIATLGKDEIKEEVGSDGNKIYRLRIKMQKTKDNLASKLSKSAVEIYLQYKGSEGDFIFPILNRIKPSSTEEDIKKAISRRNAYYNKIIKLLISKAGIKKKISMHCSRHTFATISLDLNIPIQVVSNLLGHKNLRETQIYAKILDKQKDAAIDAWDNL